jgi:two-component system copper resistance phosphate regulon response regulator CusR
MRVLIVEDNQTTADYLHQGLSEHCFLPDIAPNGQEGLFLMMNQTYDVIILDVMLPYLDGWALVKKIRDINQHIPVLFLTAKDTVDDRVKGLELGADDYLIKPFAFSELLARIRSLLRRKQPQVDTVLQLANLKIDIKKHKAVRGEHELMLTAKEFMLLHLFVSRASEVLSRTFIAEQVWDIHFDTDTNAIDVAIKRLRDKIDKGFDTKLIHSVRGVGYVFEER